MTQTIDPKLIDQLLQSNTSAEDITGENGLLKQLTKAILERSLQGEMTHHLGHEPHARVQNETRNTRNGKSRKTVQGEFGKLTLEIPRDRDGSFEPVLIGKHERRFTGFDDKILALYSRGMSTTDIQEVLKELYGVDVDSSLVSLVTNGVLEEIKLFLTQKRHLTGLGRWQSRPLERVYPVLVLDCIFVKVRENHAIINKAVYVAIGVNSEGYKDVLGLWLEKTEGAKFWLSVLTELKNRGVQDVLIACVDGLKGFPEAIEAVSPKAVVQTCIVHMVR
jgi:putative transposase